MEYIKLFLIIGLILFFLGYIPISSYFEAQKDKKKKEKRRFLSLSEFMELMPEKVSKEITNQILIRFDSDLPVSYPLIPSDKVYKDLRYLDEDVEQFLSKLWKEFCVPPMPTQFDSNLTVGEIIIYINKHSA